ncbi:MAG: hypothetical protein M0P13_08455, partial [Fibrobacteraceae bacterium]|nr:hypothetical protein [Fibrobacteraceae bacterium]
DADAKGINNTLIDALRHPCGSVIQPSKLGCATLTLRATDHFCAYVLVGATRQCACKHARNSRFSRQSFPLPQGSLLLLSHTHL